jgi:hypothetical protein
MTATPVPVWTSLYYLSWLILLHVEYSYQNAVHDSNACFVRTTIAFLIAFVILEGYPRPKKETRVCRPLNL